MSTPAPTPPATGSPAEELPAEPTPVTDPGAPPRLTPDDLQWWLTTAPTLNWTYAKTMPEWPHDYVVRGRDLTADEMRRAAAVIHVFGQPQKFYDRTQVYLYDHETGVKWWTMTNRIDDTRVINRTGIDDFYGEQDAPRTETHRFTMYDALAKEYDSRYTTDDELRENAAVRDIVFKHFQDRLPDTLDIGCGTGLALDMHLTHPHLYTGVDPARGMLNELVWKHPEVRALHAQTAESFAHTPTLSDTFDLVLGTFGAPSYVAPGTLPHLADTADHPGALVLMMFYRDGYLPDYYGPVEQPPAMRATSEEFHEYAHTRPQDQVEEFRLGNFDCVVIRRG